jgi:hypothetical protein
LPTIDYFTRTYEDLMSDNPFQSPETTSGPDWAAAGGDGRRSKEDLLAIASAQRWLMVAILGHFLAIVFQLGGPRTAPLILVVAVFVVPIGLYGVMKLAARLYRSRVVGILNGLAMFLPLIGLFVLLILNGRATRLLRKYGIRIGLMGARSADLNRLRDDAFDPSAFPARPTDG